MMEEQRFALEFGKLAKEKEDANGPIMFMNPNFMDATARAYWELTRAKIMPQSMATRSKFMYN
jgi:hypothetical protein